MLLYPREIGNVADMICFPVLIDVFVRHFQSRYLLNQGKSLKNRNGIFPAAAKIINRCRTRVLDELIDKLHNIVRMNVVSDLLPFVPENRVFPPFEVTPDEIAEKPVQLDSGMVWACQTATTEAAGWHSEIPAVLLHHHVGGDF